MSIYCVPDAMYVLKQGIRSRLRAATILLATEPGVTSPQQGLSTVCHMTFTTRSVRVAESSPGLPRLHVSQNNVLLLRDTDVALVPTLFASL